MINKIIKRLIEVYKNREEYNDLNEPFGLEAEFDSLGLMSDRLKNTGWNLYHSLRVPNNVKKRHEEIDFILVNGLDIVIVELKNWSGKLEIINGNFVQHKRGAKESQNHGDVFKKLIDKKESLKKYLLEEAGFKKEIKEYLVFYNKNLILPKEVISSEKVLKLDNLLDSLPEGKNTKDNIFERIFKFFSFKRNAITPKMMQGERIHEATEALEKLGTWDTIILNGGKKINGDIGTGKNERVIIYRKEITDRRKIQSLKFNIERNFIIAIFRKPQYSIEIKYRNDQILTIKINKNDYINFRSAGSKESNKIKFKYIDSLEYGYKSKFANWYDWKTLRTNNIYKGEIRRTEKYGVFVDIGFPRWGLLHKSKLKDDVSPGSFNIGDVINAKIISVYPKESKINLEMV